MRLITDTSFPNVLIPVPQQPHDQEAKAEQASTQEVPKGSQEWNCNIVWVQLPVPNKVYHPVRNQE